LKAVGSVKDILDTKTSEQTVLEIAADDLAALEKTVERMPGVVQVEIMDDYVQVISGDGITATQLNRYCFDNGIVLSRLNMKRKSLESTFLEITGTKSER